MYARRTRQRGRGVLPISGEPSAPDTEPIQLHLFTQQPHGVSSLASLSCFCVRVFCDLQGEGGNVHRYRVEGCVGGRESHVGLWCRHGGCDAELLEYGRGFRRVGFESGRGIWSKLSVFLSSITWTKVMADGGDAMKNNNNNCPGWDSKPEPTSVEPSHIHVC